MTRERKLAIQMWEGVKKQLPEWYKEHPCDIVDFLRYFKANFCDQNGLAWLHNCWLCQYIYDKCDKCPLRSCDYEDPLTAWARIVDEQTTLEVKLQAVDEIIAALKGEHK